MTLQEEIRELIVAHALNLGSECEGSPICPKCQPIHDSLSRFADALLEEVAKIVCQLCAAGVPFSPKQEAHNVGTEKHPNHRYCAASTIRPGKGK